MRALPALIVLGLASTLFSACGSAPPAPTPIPVQGPTLACPSGITVDSEDEEPVAVSFATPVPQGGSAPVGISCNPGPGSRFPVGTTAISCTATDSRALTGTCGFSVTVTAPPRLTKTRFLAFGDSITAGVISDAVGVLGPSYSYPSRLNDAIRDRYRRQTVTIENVGVGAEVASDDLDDITSIIGENRFAAELGRYTPEVVLLMEGTNDLFFCAGNGACPDDGVPWAIGGLDRMIGIAKQRGLDVMLATIPPQRSGGARNRGRVAGVIPRLNDEIRALAARRGATLVDVYAAMEPRLQALIGVDDLHPTDEGFRVITDTFFAAIRATFEARPAGLTMSRLRGR